MLRRFWFWCHGWHNHGCSWCKVRGLYVCAAHERGEMPATKYFAAFLMLGVGIFAVIKLIAP